MNIVIEKLSLMSLKFLKPLTAIAAIVCCLASCAKEPHYNTGHPNHGKIISLTTDWTNRGEGVEIPASYNIKVGDYTTTLSGTTNEVNNYFEAGAYHINIWNPANNISVAGTTAAADYSSELGWFFTGSQDETIEKDKDYAFTVPMQQQVRQLTLVLEATGNAKDKIAAVDAVLSGVAGAINIDNGNPVGNPVAVVPVFARQADGKYSATIRLLGIAGNTQTLTVTLSFADGNTQTATSDLSNPMAAFNTDKKTPLTLNATIEVISTESGFTAIIHPWTGNGKTIIAYN